jgi:uncharacterized protein YeaO (DUF488 family)
VYEQPDASDGARILVDRLWPRGVRADTAHLDDWIKDVAPSSELRNWFGHDPDRFDEFRRRYLGELAEPARRAALNSLRTAFAQRPLTLLTATQNAVGVHYGPFGRGEPVGADQGVLGQGESFVGSPGLARLQCHALQDVGPQVPVVGLLGAAQRETQHSAGFVVGAFVDGHEPRDLGEVADRAEQLGPQLLRAGGLQQPGRPAQLGPPPPPVPARRRR